MLVEHYLTINLNHFVRNINTIVQLNYQKNRSNQNIIYIKFGNYKIIQLNSIVLKIFMPLKKIHLPIKPAHTFRWNRCCEPPRLV